MNYFKHFKIIKSYLLIICPNSCKVYQQWNYVNMESFQKLLKITLRIHIWSLCVPIHIKRSPKLKVTVVSNIAQNHLPSLQEILYCHYLPHFFVLKLVVGSNQFLSPWKVIPGHYMTVYQFMSKLTKSIRCNFMRCSERPYDFLYISISNKLRL